MNKKLTITIGIPAYKAEKNIQNILRALLKQKEENIRIEKIIVYYDCSGDNTVNLAKKIKNKKIKIIENKKRMGFAHSIKGLMEMNTSDVLLELNDDILIKDKHLVKKIAAPFIKNPSVGFASGNPQPLPARNFIQKAIISTFRAYERMKNNYRNGNSWYTCDGKLMAYSKEFIEKIKFPKSYSLVGNVDSFSYFSCLEAKFDYGYARDAVVYFNCPDTIREFVNWSIRNNTDYYKVLERFGNDIVKKESEKPVLFFTYSLFTEFLKNPLGSSFIFLLGLYIKYKARTAKGLITGKWDVIASTKEEVKQR